MGNYWITTHWPTPEPFSRHVFVKDQNRSLPQPGDVVFIRETKAAIKDKKPVRTVSRHHRGRVTKGIAVPTGTGGIIGFATVGGGVRNQLPEDILYDFGDLREWGVIPCVDFQSVHMPLLELKKILEINGVMHLNLRRIADNKAQVLLSRLVPNPKPAFNYPDEISQTEQYFEGASKQVLVNAYERDKKARDACIKFHGAKCQVCLLSFPDRYEGLGEGFIHVHHLTPMSQIRKGYKVDPTTDLMPVCPNCHAMLHTSPPISVNELKRRFRVRNPE